MKKNFLFTLAIVSLFLLSGCVGVQTTTEVHNLPDPSTITISAEGFFPAQLEVKTGEKVTFVNTDEDQHWPASDPHPSHGICAGFDAKKGLQKDEKYEVTFQEAKTCSFHDHLNPSLRGTITIQ
jgi:plastocyanin